MVDNKYKTKTFLDFDTNVKTLFYYQTTMKIKLTLFSLDYYSDLHISLEVLLTSKFNIIIFIMVSTSDPHPGDLAVIGDHIGLGWWGEARTGLGGLDADETICL